MKNRNALLFVLLIALALSVPALLPAGAPAAASGTISGKVSLPAGRNAADAVVYIASAPGPFTLGETPEVNQRDIRFLPHVLPILVGTTVRFVNGDDVQHNVFTPSAAGEFFNLGTWPKGQAKTFTFAKMGKVELLCNVHHEMRAYILVLQNPYFAVAGKDGSFRITNVPPGTYQLKVWHERATAAPATVQVSNGAQTVNFELAAK